MMEFSAAAMVGGTSSRIAGGSFESGAVIGFFSRAFNEALHGDDDYSGPVYDSLRRFRDWITAPNHWWNDPNSPLTQTTDLGEILRGATCVSICMFRKYPTIVAQSLAEGAVITAASFYSGPVGAIYIMHAKAFSDAGTATSVIAAFSTCSCNCE